MVWFRFGQPLIDFKWKVCAGRNRRTGEEDILLVVDSQLPSHQELLHTTAASCKLVPRFKISGVLHKSYWALSLTLRYLLFVSQELEEMAGEHAQMHELQQIV
ncbi:hypothetical protein Taro_011624 [Colocasia esculenta]|uniref:Uncharacterized protein n=1 Tax=Colocasia esculenta TaxID=4460 RepID=A0A843U1V5_COLES|nr:hypothetical protein [Colocasia esculenta]